MRYGAGQRAEASPPHLGLARGPESSGTIVREPGRLVFPERAGLYSRMRGRAAPRLPLNVGARLSFLNFPARQGASRAGPWGVP
jgi:hypothetical protein